MSRARVVAISAAAGALIGAGFFYIIGWGAGIGALLGLASGLSAAIAWYWGAEE
ncbi:MAG: hypothetical protein H8D78_06540 [Chloroflexi bacterium]|nr:hypothetical protein [Chloroflexota bacterium]